MDMNAVLKLAAKLMRIEDFSAHIDTQGNWQLEVSGIGPDGYVTDYAGYGKTFGYAARDIKRYLKHKIETGEDLPPR